MSEQPTTPHDLINPESMAPPIGFSHAVASGPGRTVWFGGQTALTRDNVVEGETFVEQFDRALGNLATALREAGGEPTHLVQMQLFTTDPQAYRDARKELAGVYRKYLGRHYPAMALFGVTELFDPEAMIEIMAVAVIPE